MYILGKRHTNFQLNLKLKAVSLNTMLRLHVHVYYVL